MVHHRIWRPHFLKDIATLERIQCRATKMILNDFSSDYTSRLVTLRLLPLMQGSIQWGGGGRGEPSLPNTPTSPPNIQASPPVTIGANNVNFSRWGGGGGGGAGGNLPPQTPQLLPQTFKLPPPVSVACMLAVTQST